MVSVETFGQRLARMRKMRNLTKQALAEQAGVSDVAIGFWEHDRKCPSAENLAALATVFRCTLDYLYRGPTRQRRAP